MQVGGVAKALLKSLEAVELSLKSCGYVEMILRSPRFVETVLISRAALTCGRLPVDQRYVLKQ
jgi:hypothetical protein